MALWNWLREKLDVEVPTAPLLPGSDAPLDYLCHVFFEGETLAPRDCVVWAARGAGKTFFAAVATLLDLVFKPGVEVKVLGGSREQSERMHAHLRRLFERPGFAAQVDGKIGERRGRLLNGSTVEVLAQSQTSVRGTRPTKLRCDEVELFDEEVWEAAQLVTRSKMCDGALVRGTVEALSTCHRAGGLMSRLIEGPGDRRVFRWTAVDVFEKCGEERECGDCGVWDECGGAAKKVAVGGHFLIEDALVMKRRVGREAWEAEMMCRGAGRRRGAVFPEFDPAVHVAEFDEEVIGRGEGSRWIAGMDFGMRSPAVVLWACVDGVGVVRVVAERMASGVVLDGHVRALTLGEPGEARGLKGRLPVPAWVGVDPAGNQRSEQTGMSAVAVLRRAGLAVRWRRSGVDEGLRLIRGRLEPASGPASLIIHARCTGLIGCMQNYRYPENSWSASPVKDGHDHAVDALRYMLLNLDGRGVVVAQP